MSDTGRQSVLSANALTSTCSSCFIGTANPLVMLSMLDSFKSLI